MTTPKAPEPTTSAPAAATQPATKADLEKQLAELHHQENKDHGGAMLRTPKEELLDASDMDRKNPQFKHRWLNSANAEKFLLRTTKGGYVIVPESEGGRRVGNLVLARIPRAEYDRRCKLIAETNRSRLVLPHTDVDSVGAAIERELRDKHGIKAKVTITTE